MLCCSADLIGTFVRTFALDTLVRSFIQAQTSKDHKQIVSLGAGSDTRYFTLHQEGLTEKLRYFELDFAEITAKKAAAIKKNRPLAESLGEEVRIIRGGSGLASPSYTLLPTDLRNLQEMWTELKEHGFDPSLPTLFLSECVLIYLDVKESDAIIQHVAQECTAETMFLIYEQIRPNDAFGKTMLQNLRNRNIELKSLSRYPDPEALESRFFAMGYGTARAYDIHEAENLLPKDELSRISQLEMLDEIEEWTLLAQHYCIAWAAKNAQTEGIQDASWHAQIGLEKETV